MVGRLAVRRERNMVTELVVLEANVAGGGLFRSVPPPSWPLPAPLFPQSQNPSTPASQAGGFRVVRVRVRS